MAVQTLAASRPLEGAAAAAQKSSKGLEEDVGGPGVAVAVAIVATTTATCLEVDVREDCGEDPEANAGSPRR